jgi:ribosome-associated toxin RatA of RatAB toxin-antitoxin module
MEEKNTLIYKIFNKLLIKGELNEHLIRYCIKKARKDKMKIYLYLAYEIAKNSPQNISQNILDALSQELMNVDFKKAKEIIELGRLEDMKILLNWFKKKRLRSL